MAAAVNKNAKLPEKNSNLNLFPLLRSRNTIFWYFLPFILLLAGCCRNADLPLELTLAKAWIPYASSQEIKFLGENKDTIIISATLKNYYQQATDQACGTYQVQTREVIFTSPTDESFRLVISLSHEIVLNLKAYNYQTKQTGLAAKFNTVSELYITHAWRDTYTKSKALNGQTYAQTLQVFGNPIPGTLVLSDVLYARDKGLIGFKTFTGGWYYLLL